MSEIRQKNSTNNTIYVIIRSKSSTPVGMGLTGLVFNTSGLVASYVRDGGSRTAITLVTQTVTGAWTSGGFKEIDATNVPGLYRIDVPDAAFATGVNKVRILWTGANSLDDGSEIDLVTDDAYAAGLTTGQIAGGVWDEARSGHSTAGTFGQGAASVQGNVTGSVASVTADVGVTQAGADKVWTTTTRAVTDKSGFALSASGMDAPLDAVNAVETGLSIRGQLRLAIAVLLGKLTGAGTGTEVVRAAVSDAKVRATVTDDSSGNRTGVVTDIT